jgi:hypothetical protein
MSEIGTKQEMMAEVKKIATLQKILECKETIKRQENDNAELNKQILILKSKALQNIASISFNNTMIEQLQNGTYDFFGQITIKKENGESYTFF